MSARNLLIAIAFFVILVNIKAAFIQIPISGDWNARHGSYGVTATVFHDNGTDYPKVFFMGNSVYYGTEVIPQINEIQSSENVQFQTGNFGFTGASIFDYIYSYAHIRQFKPDLLVVQFNPTSFGYAGPYYRNDGHSDTFRKDKLSYLGQGFIRETFSKDDMTAAICHSYLPVARSSKIYKTAFHNRMKRIFKNTSSLKLWKFFPNRLNGVGEWAASNRQKSNADNANNHLFIPESGPANEQEYLSAEIALQYFIEQLNDDGQKAIFILQPSSFNRLPIMDNMEGITSESKNITFQDNHHLYDSDLYIDKIHPNKEGAVAAAQRHLELIENSLTK